MPGLWWAYGLTHMKGDQWPTSYAYLWQIFTDKIKFVIELFLEDIGLILIKTFEILEGTHMKGCPLQPRSHPMAPYIFWKINHCIISGHPYFGENFANFSGTQRPYFLTNLANFLTQSPYFLETFCQFLFEKDPFFRICSNFVPQRSPFFAPTTGATAMLLAFHSYPSYGPVWECSYSTLINGVWLLLLDTSNRNV